MKTGGECVVSAAAAEKWSCACAPPSIQTRRLNVFMKNTRCFGHWCKRLYSKYIPLSVFGRWSWMLLCPDWLFGHRTDGEIRILDEFAKTCQNFAFYQVNLTLHVNAFAQICLCLRQNGTTCKCLNKHQGVVSNTTNKISNSGTCTYECISLWYFSSMHVNKPIILLKWRPPQL